MVKRLALLFPSFSSLFVSFFSVALSLLQVVTLPTLARMALGKLSGVRLAARFA